MSPLRFAPPFAFETEEQRRAREERRRQQAHRNEVQRFQQRAADFKAKQQQKAVRRQQNIASETNRFQRLAQGFQAQQQERVAKRREEIGGEVSRFREMAQGLQAEQQEKVNLRRQDIGAEVGAFRRRADDFMRQQQERKAALESGKIPLGRGTHLQLGETMPPLTAAESRYFQVPGPAGDEVPFAQSELGLAQRQHEWRQGRSLTPEEIESLRSAATVEREEGESRRGGIMGTLTDVAGVASQLMRPPSEIVTELYSAIPRALGQGGRPTAAESSFAVQADVAVPPGPFESMIGPTALDAIEQEFGPNVRREVEFLTSPTGAITTALFPVEIAAGGITGAILAEAGREVGASDEVQMALQAFGNVAAGGGALRARTFKPPTGPGVRGLTTGAAKPMTEADVLGSRFTDVASRGRAVDIPAGARGTAGELRTMQETAAEFGTRPWAASATAKPRGPDLVAGGALARLTNIIRQTKPLRGEAEEFKSGVLSRKAAALQDVQAGMGGEAGFYKGRGVMRGPNLPARGEALAPDTMVWAKDRKNIGRIQSISDDGVTAEVHFYNRRTGAEATKTMTTSDLTPFGGEIRWQFTQTEIDALVNHPLTHPARAARPFEAANAQDAFLDTLSGKLPTGGQFELLEKYYGTALAQAVRSNRPLGAKAWESLVDLYHLPRTVMSSIDHSFPLRQGIMVAPRHPKEWFGSFPESLRSAFSPKRAQVVDDAMRNDATVIKTNYGPRTVSELAEEGGLFQARMEGVSMAEREEFFLSNLAKRIPILGAGVRWSERAYVTYGNKLRHDIFKNTLLSWQNAERGGRVQITPKKVEALANLINRMTGRGTLGPLNRLGPEISAGFFAPKFAVSRPQAFLQLFNWQNPEVARMAAGEIVSFVALCTSILSLLKLSGAADVELDPRSADFGKVKIGNTRFDFWGGNVQWARFVTQLQQEKRKTSTGMVVPSDRVDAILRFGRTKLHPIPGAGWSVAAGETMIGEKFPPTGIDGLLEAIFEGTAPMAVQDLKEAVEEHGMRGFLFGTPAFGGIGVQTYETRPQAFERVTGRDYNKTPPVLRRQIIEQTPELQRFEPGEPSESELIRMSTSEKLQPLAQAVLQGTPGAARNYQENRPSIMSGGAGAAEWVFRDLDIEPVGRDNEILEQYYAVDFLADHDGNGIPGDDEDVRMAFAEQDELKAQLSPAVRKAMDNPENFFPVEEVLEVEKRRDLAVDRIRYLIDNIPKYSKETVEGSEKIDDFVRYVRQQQDDGIHEHGEDRWGWSLPKLAIELGKERNDRGLGQAASWVLSRKIKWNDEYNDYLINNQEAIAPFFPRMYDRVIFRRPGVLSDEIWKEVNLPRQAPGVPTMPETLGAFKS